MGYKTREEAEARAAERARMDKVCFSHIENYVSRREIVVREYDGEFEVVEVKHCQDCGKTWYSLDIYVGSPRETCPDCMIAIADKRDAGATEAQRRAKYNNQREEAYDRHEQPYD